MTLADLHRPCSRYVLVRSVDTTSPDRLVQLHYVGQLAAQRTLSALSSHVMCPNTPGCRRGGSCYSTQCTLSRW
jgi:hypothetical protein